MCYYTYSFHRSWIRYLSCKKRTDFIASNSSIIDGFCNQYILIDDSGLGIGPAAYARTVNVDTGERLNITLEVENTGNADLNLTVRVSPELTTWTIQVSCGLQTENRQIIG